ncbi:alcohol dehydrogenase catalytic domain-containing protein [Microvirga ossetica]|nr:alcohol dehydrogenase catalytic domain-containing protein [Microvirga ossetica]
MSMATANAAMCLDPSGRGGFMMRQVPRRKPAADEVGVAVAAASVNPIDVHRAQGYGRRLLSLLGAGKFPMVLGNDLAGTVTALGTGVSRFKVGDRVYGVKPTSAEGTHASHVQVKANYLLPVPEERDLLALAALPYCFVTMWLATFGAGLTRENASEKSVLVHGAAGSLGTLALQMLSEWGAKVTAIARPSTFDACIGAGAADVVDCTKKPFSSLGRSFDATLNFATWDDDLSLLGCLRDRALGHATTVHPMLRNFDELGWVRGGLRTISDKKRHRSALPKGIKHYAWTVFRPDEAALSELSRLVEQNCVSLPIGLLKPFEEAAEAFDHVRKGKPGRALLTP